MALCADESIFFAYYPAESKSFCGRVIREEIEDGFIPNTHGSPKRTILKRQTLPNFMPQPAAYPAHPRSQPNLLPSTLNSAQLPSNWRESTPKPINFDPSIPPPGFEPKFQLTPNEQRTNKPRQRKRNKNKGQPIETINEHDGSFDKAD